MTIEKKNKLTGDIKPNIDNNLVEKPDTSTENPTKNISLDEEKKPDDISEEREIMEETTKSPVDTDVEPVLKVLEDMEEPALKEVLGDNKPVSVEESGDKSATDQIEEQEVNETEITVAAEVSKEKPDVIHAEKEIVEETPGESQVESKEESIPEVVEKVEEPALEESLPDKNSITVVESGEKSMGDKAEGQEVNEPEVHVATEESKEKPVKSDELEKLSDKQVEVKAVSKEEDTDKEDAEIKEVDYSTLSMEDLVNTLDILVSDRPVQEIRNDLEQIKSFFYKKLKLEIEKKKEAFLKDGGKEEEFGPIQNPLEERLKGLLNNYKRKKASYNHQVDLEKQTNLEEKYRIIESIKGLINKEESINKTFQEFRDLQHQWKLLGPIPQSKLKDLWENYHYRVEKFYDYIKINKELRDLDLRKNLESKMALCEKTEKLLEESNVVSAFRTLQKYHEQWREIGPVPHESKEVIWERFRSFTSLINRKHQKHFEDIKASLKQNLDLKTALCEKVEAISKEEIKSNKDWEKKSNEIVGIQKDWKTIGFAPKKYNTLIYDRFRKACDEFFNNRRAYYAENKEAQLHNLQLKTDLCSQAEEVMNSEDWKKVTESLIGLQKKWKDIGPVPRRSSDKVWKRFRSACDTFFHRKSEFFANIDQKYDENLKLKEALLEELASFKPSDNLDDNFARLKQFQQQWLAIGFVPIKKKDSLMQQYKHSVDKFYDSLKLDDSRKNIIRYRNKLEEMASAPHFKGKLYAEREKFANRLKTLEGDIILWENNIGFFAKSVSANAMIEEVTRKIENAKKSLNLLKEKIRMIDKVL